MRFSLIRLGEQTSAAPCAITSGMQSFAKGPSTTKGVQHARGRLPRRETVWPLSILRSPQSGTHHETADSPRGVSLGARKRTFGGNAAQTLCMNGLLVSQ